MENILQLNSNTFFIDRKSNDFAIIENFLLKKASEKGIKDVEEIEIVISSDYNYDMEFKTREGSVRIKEAILPLLMAALPTILPMVLPLGAGFISDFMFKKNPENGTAASPNILGKLAGNPLFGLLNKHPLASGLLSIIPSILGGGGAMDIIGAFMGGSMGGGLGGIAANVMNGMGVTGGPYVAALLGASILNQAVAGKQEQVAANQEAAKNTQESVVPVAPVQSQGYYETVPKPAEIKTETKPIGIKEERPYNTIIDTMTGKKSPQNKGLSSEEVRKRVKEKNLRIPLHSKF